MKKEKTFEDYEFQDVVDTDYSLAPSREQIAALREFVKVYNQRYWWLCFKYGHGYMGWQLRVAYNKKNKYRMEYVGDWKSRVDGFVQGYLRAHWNTKLKQFEAKK